MKKSFSRTLSLLLAILLVFSLCACNPAQGDGTGGSTDGGSGGSNDGGTPPVEGGDDPSQGGGTGGSADGGSGDDNGGTPPAEGGEENNAEIKNIIIIIGDGMGLEHISAGEMYVGQNFKFTDWQFVSVNTDSVYAMGAGSVLTDSAAAGTALATGKLTVNGYFGKDNTGTNVTTILDVASALNKSTGIVTTDVLYAATPAAFSAHGVDRNDSETAFVSQLASGVNLLCGKSDAECTSRVDEIAAAGYAYCDSFSAINTTFSANKTYWQLPVGGTVPEVKLCDATLKALEYLEQDEDGFVLMVEQAYIDGYSHSNDFERTAQCVKSLNDTVDAVMSWLGDRTDTVVLVTADHETGGLTVSNEDRLAEKYVNGDKTIYYQWAATNHTNAKVGLFVYGTEVDFSKFTYYGSQHLIKNVDVYSLMAGLLPPVEFKEPEIVPTEASAYVDLYVKAGLVALFDGYSVKASVEEMTVLAPVDLYGNELYPDYIDTSKYRADLKYGTGAKKVYSFGFTNGAYSIKKINASKDRTDEQYSFYIDLDDLGALIGTTYTVQEVYTIKSWATPTIADGVVANYADLGVAYQNTSSLYGMLSFTAHERPFTSTAYTGTNGIAGWGGGVATPWVQLRFGDSFRGHIVYAGEAYGSTVYSALSANNKDFTNVYVNTGATTVERSVIRYGLSYDGSGGNYTSTYAVRFQQAPLFRTDKSAYQDATNKISYTSADGDAHRNM